MLLGLLVGCGLRRGELAGLEFPDVAQREGRWAIVDLVGKHGRVRTVPMPSWAKDALDRWASTAQISTGAVLRRVDKAGRVGHASIQTTERYLGLKQNLHDAPCDRLGLAGWEG